MSDPIKIGFFSKETYTKFKILFKLVNYIKTIFVLPIIVLHLLIYPLIRIKFGYIMTKTIGNSLGAFEIFVYENQNKNEIIFWYTDNLVANNYWYKKIKKRFLFIPGFIGSPIYSFYKKFRFLNNFIVPKRNFESSQNLNLIKTKEDLSPITDINDVLKKNPPLIKFNSKEIKAGEKFLEDNNIEKHDTIICIHVRSSSYRNETINSIRNSNINNFEKSIKFLIGMGCKVIRMGRDEKDIFLPKNKDFFDYASSKDQNDFLDFYLIHKCKFFICAASGVTEIAKIMRKPMLIHNYFPLINLIHSKGNYKKLILPKKIVNRKNGKLETFTEMFKKDFVKLKNYTDLENNGIDLIENTDLEILNSVKEMYDLVINNRQDNINQSKFIMNYKKLFNGLSPNIKISSSFYKENIDLFEKEYY